MGKDVIMLLIEQLGIVLAYALNLMRAGLFEQALQAVDEFLDPVLDGSPDEIDPPRMAESLARMGADAAAVLGIARLLKVRGEILARIRDDRCFAQYQKGLSLALTLQPSEWAGEAELVYDLYRLGEPTEHERLLLIEGMESAARYAWAEDILYDLIDASSTSQNREKGLRFYDRLLGLDDDALIQGGLPRDEVLEGRSALEAMGGGEQ